MDEARNSPHLGGYALVTGSGTRIGAEIARQLEADGWKLAIHAHHSQASAQALAARIQTEGGAACVVTGDLSEVAVIDGLFAQAKSLGFCSLVINSAAIFEYDDIASVTAEALDRAYAVMLRAPLLLSRRFAEQLPDGAKGLIINLLDQKVFNLNRDFFSYTVMKCALEAATRLLALSLAPRIRVCAVAPGLSLPSGDQTERGFREAHAQALLGFGSTPADIADAVRFIVRSPAMTGQTLVVDGGQSLVGRERDVMFSHERTPQAGDPGSDRA